MQLKDEFVQCDLDLLLETVVLLRDDFWTCLAFAREGFDLSPSHE